MPITMKLHHIQPNLLARLAVGFIVGAAIFAVDNFAFRGEVSPIVIVGLLLTVGAATGAALGLRAVIVTAIIWIWLPMAHLVKHLLNLPDTLHPNSYASILKLAVFTLAVTSVGVGFGLFLHRFVRREVQ